MLRIISARVIATSFALASFSAATIVGMAVGNSTVTIIWRATLIMLISGVIGRVLGAIAQRTVDDHIAQYKSQHPISEQPTSSDDGGLDQGSGGRWSLPHTVPVKE